MERKDDLMVTFGGVELNLKKTLNMILALLEKLFKKYLPEEL